MVLNNNFCTIQNYVIKLTTREKLTRQLKHPTKQVYGKTQPI